MKKNVILGLVFIMVSLVMNSVVEAKRLKIFETIKADRKVDFSESPNVMKEVEPNDELGSAQVMEMGKVMKGWIGKSQEIDAYSFQVSSNKREVVLITLDNTAPEIATNLVIYTQDKQAVGWVSSRRAGVGTIFGKLTAFPNETYIIQVFSSDYGIGLDYALKHRDKETSKKPYYIEVRLATEADGIKYDTFEPNEDLLHATPVEVNQPVKATIEPKEDVDFYKFHVASTKNEEIDLILENPTDNLALNFILYDSDRKRLGWQSSKKGEAVVHRKLVTQPNQDYYLAVFSSVFSVNAKYAFEERNEERSNKEYTLKINKVALVTDKYEPNESIDKAKKITIGETRATINPGWDKDWYQFKAPHSGNIEITLFNDALNITPWIRIYNENREKMGKAGTDTRGAAKVAMTGKLTGGKTYYLLVMSNKSYYNKPDDQSSDKEYTIKIEMK